MEIIDAAIEQIAQFEREKQDNLRTMQFVKSNKLRFFQQVGDLALIPQVRVSAQPLMHIGCGVLLPMDSCAIQREIDQRCTYIDAYIAALRFQYFPESLLGPEQLLDINKRIRKQSASSCAGYALRVENNGISVQESAGVRFYSKQRKISKFAISHGIQ